MNLFFAILIGTAVGVLAIYRRSSGIVIFAASAMSFATAFRLFHMKWIGFIASGGGVGILLVIVILGLYVPRKK
jgi:hypothetical protein